MRTLSLVIALLISSLFFGQVVEIEMLKNKEEKISPLVQQKIEDYSVKIDSLVQRNKASMELEIKAAELQKERGEITDEQLAETKSKIAKDYSENLNKQLTELQSELEQIIQQQVELSIKYDSPQSVSIEAKDPYHGKRISAGGIYISYGLSGLTEDWDLGSINDSNLRFGPSSAFEISWKKRTKLSHSSPFAFYYGLGFLWRTYKPDNNQFIDLDEDGNTIFSTSVEDLDRSKFRTAYLFIPFDFDIALGKVRTYEDGFRWRSHQRSFRIGFGAYAGLKLNQRRILRFDDEANKSREDFNLNNFMYGLRFSVSKDWFTIYMRKDLSPLFDEDRFESPINNPVEFGISIELF